MTYIYVLFKLIPVYTLLAGFGLTMNIICTLKYCFLFIWICSITACNEESSNDLPNEKWNTHDYKIDIYHTGRIATLIVPRWEYDALNADIISYEYAQVISNRLLNYFEDKFNHIVIVNNNLVRPEHFKFGGFHVGVGNEVQGIGKELYDNSIKFGSNGVLKSIIHFPSTDNVDAIYHELLHQFSNDYIPTQESGHYSFTTGGILGGFYPYTLKYLTTNTYQANNIESNTFHILYNPVSTYSLVDLYLMGLASKDEFPVIEIAKCDKSTQKPNCPHWIDENNGIFYAGYIETLTIGNLIKTHGERIPNYQNAPKQFRGIVVLVSATEISEELLKGLDELVKIR